MRGRRLLGLAASAVLALVVLAPAAPVDAAAEARHRTVIPGPGSLLALVEHGQTLSDGELLASKQSLVLVSPSGETRTVYTRKVTASSAMYLIDWSVDGATALLGISHRHGQLLLRVDVGSGAVSELKVKNLANAVLDPDGSGVVAQLYDRNDAHRRYQLAHITWAGAVTTYPVTTTGSLMAGPADTALTGGPTARSHTLQQVSLSTGSVVHSFPVAAGCQPVRDWDVDHVLLRCNAGLTLLDWSTGATTSLVTGAPNSESGFFDARTLPSGRYLSEVENGCDVFDVARQATNGTVHRIRVPTAKFGNLYLVGTAGKRLVDEHVPNVCTGGPTTSELALLNPVTGKEKPLLVLSKNEDFFRLVLGFGEVRGQIG